MLRMLPDASIIEIFQLLLALIGTGIAFWRLWIAFENGLRITADEATSLRRLVAETQVLSELFRLFCQGCLTGIGVVSCLLPPPMPGLELTVQELLQVQLVRFGLITLTIAMVADSLVQEYRRKQFLNRVREHDAEEQMAARLAREVLKTPETTGAGLHDVGSNFEIRDNVVIDTGAGTPAPSEDHTSVKPPAPRRVV